MTTYFEDFTPGEAPFANHNAATLKVGDNDKWPLQGKPGYAMAWGGEAEDSARAQGGLASTLPIFLGLMVLIIIFLSFLGLGVKPPTPSWGALLKDGYSLIRQTPWLVVGGGLPIILATLGFTFLGESLRDVVDPKLRKQR